MAKSFAMHWPAEIQLSVYAEGFTPDSTIVPVHRARRLPIWLEKFKARHCTDLRMNGLGGHKYNMLFDAVRFSHKVGAVIDMAERQFEEGRGGVLIWLDADTVTHSSVASGFLDRLADWPATALAWLNRVKKYPECGCVMFNLDHPATRSLITTWKTLYTEDRFLLLDHWTDCHTLEAAVSATNAPWASLSGAHAGLGHPFINGPLGSIMDHLKGDRKRLGKSTRYDLKARRLEPYWKGVRR